MHSPRLLKVLILSASLLLLILVATVILRRPEGAKRPFASQLPQTEKMTVQVATTTLSFVKDQGTWRVQMGSAGPFKADAGRIEGLQNSLKSLEVEDVISEKGQHASDFELNPDSATAITLLDKNQKELAAGLFGKRADDGAHTYFRYPNSPTIYLARGAVQVELNFNAWRDTVLLEAPEEKVLTLLIEGPGYETTLLRTSDTWSVNGNVIDPQPVWSLLGTLAHLRTQEFADLVARPDLAANQLRYATITLQLTEGPNQVLHIGSRDSKTRRYPVSVNDETSVYWLPEATVQAFLKKPSDFHGTHRLSRPENR
jgi:hypothetical protein